MDRWRSAHILGRRTREASSSHALFAELRSPSRASARRSRVALARSPPADGSSGNGPEGWEARPCRRSACSFSERARPSPGGTTQFRLTTQHRRDHESASSENSTISGKITSIGATIPAGVLGETYMAEPTQVVVTSESGLSQEIVAGTHRLKADEPAPRGADTGPSPYGLLLASLGACTSMTLRLYAQRKGWDLQRITVRLRHSRIHAEDCNDCETKEGYLDRIDREIELTGRLDDDQKRRLVETAERCPVHRTLKSEINIRTSLAA